MESTETPAAHRAAEQLSGIRISWFEGAILVEGTTDLANLLVRELSRMHFFTAHTLLGVWSTIEGHICIVHRVDDDVVGHRIDLGSMRQRGAISATQLADDLVSSLGSVDDWRNRGHERAGIVWNSNVHVRTPWSTLPPPAADPRWRELLPWQPDGKTADDRGVYSDTWAGTILLNTLMAVGGYPIAPALRLLLGWCVSEKMACLIYEYGFSPFLPSDTTPERERLKLLGDLRPPGRQNIVVGRLFHEGQTASFPFAMWALQNLQDRAAEYETAFYPLALVGDSIPAIGVRWLPPFAPMELYVALRGTVHGMVSGLSD